MAEGTYTFEVDQVALAQLRERVSSIENGMGKAVAWAANRTASHILTVVSRRIRNRVPIKKKDVEKYIYFIRAKTTDRSPQSTVKLLKGEKSRIPISYFGAQQVGVVKAQKTADRVRAFGGRRVGGGVAYPIGKHFVEGGFMGPKPGVKAPKLQGFAWIRGPSGKRYPKFVLKGPSPWGVFVLTGAMPDTLVDAKSEMDKNIAAAVNYLLLKQSGAL